MKEFPYDVDPARPIFLQGVTLTANEEKEIDLPACKVIFIVHMASLGTLAGEVSIAFGERGDFFDLAPGDEIHLTQISRVRFRNNTLVQKQFDFLHTNDKEFSYKNFNRGV